jgi:DUF3052 family protein
MPIEKLSPAARRAREERYAARDVTDKLGLKPGSQVRVVGKADRTLLEKVRAKIGRSFIGERKEADVVLYWPSDATEITPAMKKLKRSLVPNGGIWVITFKKNKGQPYIHDQQLIPAGLAAGLVDNKVCSVSDTQSAMRFVIRKIDR